MIMILLGILVLALIYIVSIYNSLATLKVKVKEAWSEIDVQLKRRTDLIPNLVETVKGYAAHEKEVFEKVTEARSALMTAGNAQQAAQAENQLTGALKSLFAVAEAYPELKASENFKQLQSDLTDTEDKISYSRQFYNTMVRDYNSKIVMFPGNLIAGMLGFTPEQFFEAAPADQQPVKVQF
ncbi:MAG TPA: LemA family protein [Candidatus Saccharimonadales bacterium]|nr:LemA family protein [Candidatus Saccharimonadales bacterium]